MRFTLPYSNQYQKASAKHTYLFLIIFQCAFIVTGVKAQSVEIVKHVSDYKKQVLHDENKYMINLKEIIPSLLIDLRYGTKENFTGEKLYPSAAIAFLRMPAAKALMKVQQQLAMQGLALKVWDAYRPHRATRRMWSIIQDERYVANPAKGSGHNRGLAIDITLVDLKTGFMLDMGTAFDHFSDTAHHDFKKLPSDVLKHRSTLKTIMEQHGFKALSTEWWHYSWPNDRNYEVLDLRFRDLQRMQTIIPPPTSLLPN